MSKEEVKLSMNVNGQSKVPPGFRFHPTEEELLLYYLRKKAANEKIDLDVIQELDLNKLEPWDIQEICNLGFNAQNEWYVYSHNDKKYPTSTRTNRATGAGFWKATGRDKVIRSSLQTIGMRKTLVFYQGRAPHGQKSDWIMHEYRLDDIIIPIQDSKVSNKLGDSTHEEGWVVCRLFTKKNYHKSSETQQRSLFGSIDTRAQLQSSNDNAMKQFMNPINDTSINLPKLEGPTMTTSPTRMSSSTFDQGSSVIKNYNTACDSCDQYSNWEDVDKFVANQLDGKIMGTKCFSSCYGESDKKLCLTLDPLDCINEPVFSWPDEDVWSLDRLSIDPLYYLSV